MSRYKHLLLARDEGVAVLTLNRPEKLNALNAALREEIRQAVAEVDADPAVRALVLHGAGRGFSSGFDLTEQMQTRPSGEKDWRPLLQEEFAMTTCVWRSRVPTIAAVHGPCLAGAFELALCCDITIASEDAMMGEPELRFGAGIVTMILPWIVGAKRAKEIILLGLDRIPAAEALAMGLVNRVVPAGQHLDAAMRAARHVAAIDPDLVARTKEALNRSLDFMGLSDGLEAALEVDVQVEAKGSPDKRRFFEIARAEGLKAAFAWRDGRFP